MQLLSIFVVIVYFLILLEAIWLFIEIYVCDKNNCKAFVDAKKKYKVGSKKYYQFLARSIFDDGSWPICYLASSVSTVFIIWLTGLVMCSQNFCFSLHSKLLHFLLFFERGHPSFCQTDGPLFIRALSWRR